VRRWRLTQTTAGMQELVFCWVQPHETFEQLLLRSSWLMPMQTIRKLAVPASGYPPTQPPMLCPCLPPSLPPPHPRLTS
jgi:hypothetical protein